MAVCVGLAGTQTNLDAGLETVKAKGPARLFATECVFAYLAVVVTATATPMLFFQISILLPLRRKFQLSQIEQTTPWVT